MSPEDYARLQLIKECMALWDEECWYYDAWGDSIAKDKQFAEERWRYWAAKVKEFYDEMGIETYA